MLLSLFTTFFKIGLFTFGGGYAMIALIERECEEKNWIDHEEMMNLTVIPKSTPGPIAINCATYVGYKQRGLLGALVATVGIVAPAFFIIFMIPKVFTTFLDYQWILYALKGIKVAVCFLIIEADYNMVQKMKKFKKNQYMIFLAFLCMCLISIFSHPISAITLMILFGIGNLLLSFKGGKV